MKIRFYVDPATGLPHIYHHDVDEDEIEEVFADLAEDRPGREDSRIAIGRTEEAESSGLSMFAIPSLIRCS